MAYEADFYVSENIIGYTGDIDDKPTVYFKRVEPDGMITFGHITQNWFDGTSVKATALTLAGKRCGPPKTILSRM